jgi:hypothetical protein
MTDSQNISSKNLDWANAVWAQDYSRLKITMIDQQTGVYTCLDSNRNLIVMSSEEVQGSYLVSRGGKELKRQYNPVKIIQFRNKTHICNEDNKITIDAWGAIAKDRYDRIFVIPPEEVKKYLPVSFEGEENLPLYPFPVTHQWPYDFAA